MTIFSAEIDQAFEAYFNAFGEGSPTEMHDGTFDDMAAVARECVARGEPYSPPLFDEHGMEIKQ